MIRSCKIKISIFLENGFSLWTGSAMTCFISCSKNAPSSAYRTKVIKDSQIRRRRKRPSLGFHGDMLNKQQLFIFSDLFYWQGSNGRNIKKNYDKQIYNIPHVSPQIRPSCLSNTFDLVWDLTGSRNSNCIYNSFKRQRTKISRYLSYMQVKKEKRLNF